ncbi:MAG: glucose 1-dehydrogenase [Rhodospirillaceae bacterium]|jgi:NAD(P)-dependent dehydrogenase (short-subunit alcohol dehydrogenase family)|nr:glucose 1-dehydrogenase [Rhodospirillaceae bacterium]MBT3886207.1 glucose 1-dehydrogenase [Rhodospirillaceae bacterium]MBT4116722.1 glucose 1-dehydrogenase [Rhodospirillaceae bacterium]MBT4671689.1 glucose 1-dehydrogenase [Rhodospirillaceae bacterium]MBT4722065.1 glucose 1-dehydrogenase [Rhodospirillaceae bacterium]
MSGRVDGKIALISGAGSGLGQATAIHLAREGARIVATDIDGGTAEATAASINGEFQGAAVSAAHDVTSQEQWVSAVDLAASHFGGLDILVNNAGISLHGDVESTPYSDFQKLMDINLNSVFLGCQEAMKVMKSSGAGSIINISSVAGKMGNPNTIAYGTTKAGVAYMTKCVALDCAQKGYKVRCNSIHPTYIRTPLIDQFLHDDEALERLNKMVPLGRINETEDVTFAILFLASDESAMMTGSELFIDGGLSAGYTPRV